MTTSYTNRVDERVLRAIPTQETQEYVPIIELCNCGFRYNTLRNALARLVRVRAVRRKWDGNQRFGRYIYQQTA